MHSKIIRNPLYFKSKEANLFGWFHHSLNLQFETAVLICSPVGKEYNSTHRTVRHLADSLASKGIPTFRFDYFSTGDSDGTEFDSHLVDHWLADIKNAILKLKEITNCTKITLVGIRLGATLVATICRELDIDLAVLWYPIYRGYAFYRELEVIARTSVKGIDSSVPYLESAGFLISNETKESLQSLNILDNIQSMNTSFLILENAESNDSKKFKELLNSQNIRNINKQVFGKEEMFDQPHLNTVPMDTINLITEWVELNSQKIELKNFKYYFETSQAISLNEKNDFDEKALIFDEDRGLFGIYTKSFKINRKPVVLILNTGADHHVGSNRLTIDFTRAFGKLGFDTFRIDLSGLGDSILENKDLENVMYSKLFSDDIKSATNFIKLNFENRDVILMGVCGGGQSTYLTAIDHPELPIVDYIIINSILYRWRDNLFLNFLNATGNNEYVEQTITDVNKWKKLISGKISLDTILKAISKLFMYLVSKIKNSNPFPGSNRDLIKISKHNKKLSLFYSDNEYGLIILRNHNKKVFSKLLKEDRLQIQSITDTDHVFSNISSREKIISFLGKHLLEKFGNL